jgi:hypothetical protein
MKPILRFVTAVLLLVSVNATGAALDDKARYDQQAAARYAALFQSLDRNGDGVVTRFEAQGDLNFVPRFDDMDIDRDGGVTFAELQRFVEREHSVQLQANAPQAADRMR